MTDILDLMIDDVSCTNPEDWNWYNLLQLEKHEQVNDVYVENMGEYGAWEEKEIVLKKFYQF